MSGLLRLLIGSREAFRALLTPVQCATRWLRGEGPKDHDARHGDVDAPRDFLLWSELRTPTTLTPV